MNTNKIPVLLRSKKLKKIHKPENIKLTQSEIQFLRSFIQKAVDNAEIVFDAVKSGEVSVPKKVLTRARQQTNKIGRIQAKLRRALASRTSPV